MKLSEFDFELPEELIAQVPLQKRDVSRLLVVNREKQSIEDKHFYDIVDYLQEGDVLVRNNTRVIPARLFGIKEETGAHVELLLLKQEGDIWECLVGNARVVKIGSVISFNEGELRARCIEIGEKGIRKFEMLYEGIFLEVLERLGHTPLPPYIHEKLEDKERYQTVYAKTPGSAAAPTAGLHFTDEIFARLKEKGVQVVDVTLHVGLGTFRPVDVDEITDHHMHSEYFELSQESADALNQAKAEGRRIISVGTTSTRVIESVYNKYGTFKATNESTSIFIYPGYEFKAVSALITNFHLPKSTLIMLVYTFGGSDLIKEAYRHAVEEKYRFFSFGDSMFIC
ncbi:MAG: tRNA preQ1(34) S-adenosylmethionine ribosyltransferase-isomerase QueA [Erysipelotrichaceae bacterium]|nr:tRNA preQ1(34) S-adenosylmethionine ribosyltransferase-isomerase QueA [Erysipelotrichaceae bacterium]